MASPAQCLGFCRQKQRLTDELFEATRELVSLLDRKIADAAKGQLGNDNADIAFASARQKRHEAKEALMLHVSVHGC